MKLKITLKPDNDFRGWTEMDLNSGELSVQAGQQVELIDTREEQVTLEYFRREYFGMF